MHVAQIFLKILRIASFLTVIVGCVHICTGERTDFTLAACGFLGVLMATLLLYDAKQQTARIEIEDNIAGLRAANDSGRYELRRMNAKLR